MTEDDIVCMPAAWWDCGQYAQRAYCAGIQNNGSWTYTPSDFPSLSMIAPDWNTWKPENKNLFPCGMPFDTDEIPENDDIPSMSGFVECSACFDCEQQVYGHTFPEPQNHNGAWWDELPWCNEKYLADECMLTTSLPTSGASLPTSGSDETSTSPEQTTGDFVCPNDSEETDGPQCPAVAVSDNSGTDLYICNGSESLSGTRHTDISTPIDLAPGPYCVLADSVEEARCDCATICTNSDNFQACMVAHNPDWSWDGFGCDALLSSTPDPEIVTNTLACTGGYPGIVPFEGDATLDLIDRGIATTEEVSGFIKFIPPSCASCPLLIAELRILLPVLHSTFIESGTTSDPVEFTITDLEAHSLQPIEAHVATATDELYYSAGSNFFIRVESGSVNLGSTELLESIDLAFRLNPPSGTWDGQTLSLQFDWVMHDSSALFSVNINTI